MNHGVLFAVFYVLPLILILLLNYFTGSLTKKSKSRGVQMEELKLAPIIDFSSGV